MSTISLQKCKIVVLGATSAIAKASCVSLAGRGATLYLTSRNLDEVARLASDLKVRYGTEVFYNTFDADNLEAHPAFFAQVLQEMGKIDGVLLAFGYLGDRKNLPAVSEQVLIFKRNLIGAISILSLFADYFEQAKQGFILTISSIAGDRGRRKNYAYAAAKSGLSTYLQGLRNRLFASGVRVITVKPGFVDTPMTAGNPHMFLVADAQSVGQRIVKQLAKRGDVLYVPWFWRCIVLAVRLIPERLFKRMPW